MQHKSYTGDISCMYIYMVRHSQSIDLDQTPMAEGKASLTYVTGSIEPAW